MRMRLILVASVLTTTVLAVTLAVSGSAHWFFDASSPNLSHSKPHFSHATKLNNGLQNGRALLKTNKKTVKLGQSFTLDIRFFNTGIRASYYNPFFQGLIPAPAQLAVFDSHHHYLGNLIAFVGGSRRMTGPDDWTYVGENSYVGTFLTLTAGRVPWYRQLPAGVYYLQMIYYRAFIAKPPGYPNDRRELFRSNVVKITFTN